MMQLHYISSLGQEPTGIYFAKKFYICFWCNYIWTALECHALHNVHTDCLLPDNNDWASDPVAVEGWHNFKLNSCPISLPFQ